MTAPIPDPAVPTAPDGDSDRAQLQPGQRVLIEAVATPATDFACWLRIGPDSPSSTFMAPEWCIWHLDDRAERDAERDRLAAELDALERQLADAVRVDDYEHWSDLVGITRALHVAADMLGEVNRERDAALAQVAAAEERAGKVVKAFLDASAERHHLRAQVAAMRDVVVSVGAIADEMRLRANNYLGYGFFEVLHGYAQDLRLAIAAVDAWRSGQIAPETAPESLQGDPGRDGDFDQEDSHE